MTALTRRDRLANIITNLCERNSPRFTVTIGNGYRHNPFYGLDVFDMLTDEALEIVARNLINKNRATRKWVEENRAAWRRANGLEVA